MSVNADGTNGNAKHVSEEEARSIGGNVSGGGPSPESEPGSVVAGAVAPPPSKLTKADFVSGQEVRWCPGCGDYSILNNVQKVMPELGIPREKIVFVSGIGCSSRFPYYMNTYGFHSIHGRAPAVASGIKSANPDLSVWVITGDGDALSIGGNHFMHAIRRNLDLNYILFNNRIYGLTKGQYSPTSELGKKTKSTPMGAIDYPLNPLSVAIASEATFVARSLDIDVKHLGVTVQAAARHKGVSFVEVYQNCNIFNDNAFDYFAERTVRSDHMIYLEHDQPMIFGKERNKGIRMNGARPEVVTLGENGITADDLLVHDIYHKDPSVAFMLARMEYPEFPQPLGIFRTVERDTYEDMLVAQIDLAITKQGRGSLEKLIHSGDTWVVE
ncbi:MAG TPA: 2-oxoacid:ferredoxin oxidoreductase subunit beta [Pyrinomonadaceae bacterium]|jgi:2-oxoglutarate ferredoxin oxidoreductase subunit beta|nr:2-oxoacid:ferredoxin oxidoreductase subunit beta [Pyrinomonadaceae bacterium]